MLKINHLTKSYGEKKAVDDLSLHIQRGEIYGFIGHNGAGKTTTLKAIVGILQFDEGEILIDGHSVRTEPLACKRDIAYIPDNLTKAEQLFQSLYPQLSLILSDFLKIWSKFSFAMSSIHIFPF